MPRWPGRFLLWIALIVGVLSARGQTIYVGQPQLNFAASPGQNSTVQVLPVMVAGTTSQLPYMVTFTPQSGGNWLYFSPTFGNLPVNVLMLASAANLAPGTYTGYFTITAPGAVNSPLVLPVIFSVGQSTVGTITVSPSAVSFTGQVNGPPPPQQLLQINVGSSPYGFTITPVTGGSGWLQVSSTQGTAPAQVAVSVVTQGLGPGYYYGTLTITPASGLPVVVPVTLFMTNNSTLNLSTSSLMFYYQTGGVTPSAQTFTLNADIASPVPFTLTPSTVLGNWLAVTPLVGNAPQTIVVAVDPNGLAPGTYAGSITVTGGSSPVAFQTLGVTLIVSNSPLLTLGTLPATFNYITGGDVPASQSVDVGSTAGPLSFTVNSAGVGGNWLSVGPASGTTPRTLAVGVNPTGLSAGVYSGLVTVTSPGVVDSPQSFPVTLNVNTIQTFTATPAALTFNYQIGATTTLNAQSLQVSSALPATVSVATATSSCGSWLTVSGSALTTPGVLAVGVSPSSILTQQVCSGTITLSLLGFDPIVVPVTLNVSRSPLLNITPTSLDFVVDYGVGNATTKALTLDTTDGTKVPYIASPALDTTWLNIAPALANAPTTVSVTFYSGLMLPGKYTGSIMFTSSGLVNPMVIPVTATIRPITTTAAKPEALSFIQPLGGAAPPAQQIVISTGSDNYPYTASIINGPQGGWLKITPVTGTTPATLSVSAAGTGLGLGSYNTSIQVAVNGASNNPLVIPVNLSVIVPSTINVAPAALTFNYQAGTPSVPTAQTLTITSGGAQLAFTAAAATAGTGSWLTASPASGITKGTVTVSVNPSGLAPGVYNGQVTITSNGAVGSPVIVPVTFTIQAQPTPTIQTLTSAASGLGGAISPGEIVTLKGVNLGPATGVGPVINAAGKVDTTVASTRVLFDTYAAPILYASAGQVNAVVPYEVASRTSVTVQAEALGVRSAALLVNTAAAAPGIFTANAGGTGQGAILNEDSSVNSVSRPQPPDR